MTRLLLLTVFVISTAAFLSCEQKTDKPDIDNTLASTTTKFPQLPKGERSFYKLVRSVIIGETGIELQLRSTPDTLDDPQKIVSVINKNKQCYSIPLFSNTYHDYWNFQFDSILASIPPTNTTFEKELKNCFTQLDLYDTLGTAGKVLNEMFVSLLQCRQVRDSDSLNLNVIFSTDNYSLRQEDTDSCHKRVHKNWQEIKKAFHPAEYRLNYYAFWDEQNKRVYQFDFRNFGRKKKLDFTLKNYRLDCVCHVLYL